jgi:hypothetical protein
MKEYITGFYALNIHHPGSKREPTGDWHGSIWKPIREVPHKDVTYAGIGRPINSFALWGNFGIYEEKEFFETNRIKIVSGPVFVADYYRAVLDLLYHSLMTYGDILNLNCATDDYFDTGDQKDIILSKIEEARTVLSGRANRSLDRWIENEMNYEKLRAEAVLGIENNYNNEIAISL